MSAGPGDSSDTSPPPRPIGNTAAAEVSFAKLNTEHHAESSSRAESRSSAGKRSDSSDKRQQHTVSKAWSRDLSPPNGDSSGTGASISHRFRQSGGFLLDPLFANGKPRRPSRTMRHENTSSEPNDDAQLGRRRNTSTRWSGESSQQSSPLSRELSQEEASRGKNTGIRNDHPKPPSMDTAQLVQMALSLSESRKRHVSGTLPVPLATTAASRRAVSALEPGYGPVRPTSSGNRKISRPSDALAHSSPSSHRPSQSNNEGHHAVMDGGDVLYTFSPATLSRAEKARRYFELASEHRRLLEHLPPLKPDATAPANYTTQAVSSPGSAHVEMTRIPTNTNSKRQLGRTYNPLQALRNRRLRNRERRSLPASPDTWQETDRIKRWIDGIEASSHDPSFRPGEDRVRLPAFSGELDGGQSSHETAKRHRKTETMSSVVTRPENGWSIEPAELLADAYWIEKDDNKTIIEDRNGTRIFPSRISQSLDVPRQSTESRMSHESTRERQSQHDPSEDEEKHRSRRRHILPIPGRLRRNHVSRSTSTTSNSSDEGRKPPALRYGDNEGGDENVGPLERHMRSMIAKEEKGELSSPEIISPDHWDSRHTHLPNRRSSIDRTRAGIDKTHRGSMQAANRRPSVDTAKLPDHGRPRPSGGRKGSVDHGTTSMDDEVMTDSPGSPNTAGFIPLVDSEMSPSTDRRNAQVEHKSKKRHLPSLHLHSRKKDQNNIERTDFADANDSHVGRPLSPVLSADTNSGQPRSSFESLRPFVKRHRTTDSNGSSLKRTETSVTGTTSKGASSTFGRRFFKGGRKEEFNRGESFRFGDRFRGSRDRLDPGVTSDMSRAQSDLSDAEDDVYDDSRTDKPKDLVADLNAGQNSQQASFERDGTRMKFYTSNLPSFKSPSGRARSSTIGTPMSEASDPLFKSGSRLQSTRRSRLEPPRIQLPDDEGVSEPDLPSGRSSRFLDSDHYDRRKSASQNNLSQVPTNSTALSRSKRKDNWPVSGLQGHDARRHWSISDRSVPPEQQHKTTHRDVARVRALLLATGIKAHKISIEADTARDTPLPLMVKAAETAGQTWNKNVSRREEHIIASRMLTEDLASTLSQFETTLQHFHRSTAKSLGNQLEELSHRVAEQLTKIVHETSDEADAFNVELTTKQPQEVKRVDEAVDAMFRQRRKQFRLVRIAGFKLLEWFVLGIMWWIWFIVVLINMFKKVVVGTVKVLGWLLWF